MGLYDQDFVDTEEYATLPRQLLGGHNPEARLYYEWTGHGYAAKSAKASAFANRPEMRFIHAMLATTLSGRGESRGVVETHDVFYLHSMVDGVPIDIGYCLAQFIARKAASLRTHSIWTGPYITRLLRGMGLLPEQLEQQFTLAAVMVPFDTAMMRAIHFPPAGAGAPVVMEPVGGDEEEQEVPQQEQDAPEEEQPEDMGGDTRWDRLERQLAQMQETQQSFYTSQATYNRDQAERLQQFIAYQEAQNKAAHDHHVVVRDQLQSFVSYQEAQNKETHDHLQQLIEMMSNQFGLGPSSSQHPPPPYPPPQ